MREKMDDPQLRQRQRRRRERCRWSSELPSRLIRNISERLETKPDTASFRQVCRKWRNFSNPTNYFSPVLPCRIPSIQTSPPLPFRHSTNCLVLQSSSIYLLTSIESRERSSVKFKPWMVMAEESSPSTVCLRHPLTGKRVKKYASNLDLTRFRATELAEGYIFKHANSVLKVLLCSSSGSSSNSVKALVLYLQGKVGKLAVGKRDDNNEDADEDEEYYEWQELKKSKKSKSWFIYLDDMIMYQGKVCGVARMGRLYALDHETMTVESVLAEDELCRGDYRNSRRKRLVVDPTLGELHLVMREHVHEKARFKVYRFNKHLCRWDHMVDGIGRDRVLFVGVDVKFGV